MEKDHFLFEQAQAFPPNSFLQMVQCCSVVVCFHCCFMVQQMEENNLYIPKILSTSSSHRLHGLEYLFHGECGMFRSTDAAFADRVK
jgi:hypothetical protein